MAIEIREEVDAQIKFVPNYIPSKDLNESLSVNPISEDSIMVDIEGIHSVITRNLNYYEPHCLEISVPRWTEPYERPLIMHHKEQDGVTIGRIKQCTYVDSCERTKGPGLVFTCNVGNKDGIEGIKNGTLVTTSIGVMVRDLRCSICGKNLAEEGECEHVKGQRYDGKLCFWIIKDMEPKELSYVIVPSDKYAHNVKIYKPDAKMLGVSESYNNEDEVNELSIKDLYYDEISKSLAMKEAKALEEDGENQRINKSLISLNLKAMNLKTTKLQKTKSLKMTNLKAKIQKVKMSQRMTQMMVMLLKMKAKTIKLKKKMKR